MIRSRRAVQVLLLTGIIVSSAFAAPIAYTINFTTTSGSPTPTSGSFTYDSGAAIGFQFAAFVVEWDGLTFDLTSDANAGGTSNGCGAANSSTVFLFLSGVNECPGTPNSFVWFGDEEAFNSAVHIDDFGNPGNPPNAYIAAASSSAGTDHAGGRYTITGNDAPPTPEPSPFILALAGRALLALNRRRPSTRIRL